MISIESISREKSAFFSVCIDVYNREKTIAKVLEAINSQTCRDFELIVVDNGSNDNSAKIILENLGSFKDIRTQFILEDRKSNEISGWNSPLRYAKGKYIAICEGDDYFRSDHLEQAKSLLQKYPQVGIYVGGSKLKKFEAQVRLMPASNALRKLMMLDWCPPPSCVVFRSNSPRKIPYYFDEDFVWAGEYSLYNAILADGHDVLENYTENFVIRGFRFYLKNSFHMRDVLKIRHGKYYHYSQTEELIVDSKLFYMAWHLLVFNLIFGKLDLKLINIVCRHFHHKSFSFSRLIHATANSSKQALSQLVKVKISG